jgi:hypothetical protein
LLAADSCPGFPPSSFGITAELCLRRKLGKGLTFDMQNLQGWTHTLFIIRTVICYFLWSNAFVFVRLGFELSAMCFKKKKKTSTA